MRAWDNFGQVPTMAVLLKSSIQLVAPSVTTLLLNSGCVVPAAGDTRRSRVGLLLTGCTATELMSSQPPDAESDDALSISLSSDDHCTVQLRPSMPRQAAARCCSTDRHSQLGQPVSSFG